MFENESMSIAAAPLGHPFTAGQLRRQCRATIGAVAWPGKNPGFGLVLAVTGGRDGLPYEFHLLDEVENEDLLRLVQKCDALDARYVPEQWIGDNQKKAAQQAVWRVAETKQPRSGGDGQGVRVLSVGRNALVDDDSLYEYAVPVLKTMLDEAERRLFLKGSRVRDYLAQINAADLPFLQHGDYPAIEALAYVTLAADDWARADEDLRRQPRWRSDPPPSAMTC